MLLCSDRAPSASTIGSALVTCGLERTDADALLRHVLGRNRAWLIAHATDPLAPAEAAAFAALAVRRRHGEPVAYLVGEREFRGLSLAVDCSVLIPRPETETLVEVALSRLPAERAWRVLDLGTGSGAVALAIAHERPLAQMLATDRSETALEVARRNARRLGLANIAFECADWYAGLGARRFDAIVSNPPYVADADPHLAQGDLRFEPRAALAAGPEGLDALRAIIAGAPSFLAPGGWLVVEHGYDQADAVRALFDAAGLADFTATRDLAGILRVAAGRRQELFDPPSEVRSRGDDRCGHQCVRCPEMHYDSAASQSANLFSMSEIIFQVDEAPEGGFVARALGHSIFTEGETLDELRVNVRDAVRRHFETGEMPAFIRLHFVRDEVLVA